MKRCPKCGNNRFFVSAHVVQEWVVDENGMYDRMSEDCVEVIHFPDDDDIWECRKCRYSAEGRVFEVKE